MAADAIQVEGVVLHDRRQQRAGHVDLEAELRRVQPGRDVGVGLRVDVRVHAQGDGRLLPELAGDLAEELQLALALDVDGANLRFEGGLQLRSGLADAAVDDAVRGDPRLQRAEQLAAADDVGPAAEGRQPLQQSEVAVGLDGVGDEGLAAALRALHRCFDRPVGRVHPFGGVDPGRRAVGVGDGAEIDPARGERARLVGEGLARQRHHGSFRVLAAMASRSTSRPPSRSRSSAMAARTRPLAGPPGRSRRSTAVSMSRAS